MRTLFTLAPNYLRTPGSSVAHRGVYHPKKPNKIRVVFDCSAQFEGESLNKHLLKGPDLTNSLSGVLYRFRREPVAIICDIESMFYQVNFRRRAETYFAFCGGIKETHQRSHKSIE